MGFQSDNLVGQKFGFLEVTAMEVEKREGKKNRYWVVCKCFNCGREGFRTDRGSVKAGRTTSCGCRTDQYLKNTGENSKQFTGYKEIRGRAWGHIKAKAKERGYSFGISIKEMWNLYEQQGRKCSLTGLPIVFAKNTGVATASLDRIDSSKGYEDGNVQWVHKDVNRMKNVFTQERFLEICELVTKRGNYVC